GVLARGRDAQHPHARPLAPACGGSDSRAAAGRTTLTTRARPAARRRPAMPASDRHVTLFHSPQSRSGGALALLEELGADYELHVLNLRQGDQRKPEYLAVNPMGKVPAIVHDGV